MQSAELTLSLTNEVSSSSIPIKIKSDSGFYCLPPALAALCESDEPAGHRQPPLSAVVPQQTIGMLVFDKQAGCLVLYPTAPQPLDQGTAVHDLSRREQEVLQLLPAGLSNRQIGRILSISESTVKSHMGNIFSKLNVSSRAEAAVYALRMGLATA
ncbi:MAG: response regulator transcription factor [Anaerolineae bacterium]